MQISPTPSYKATFLNLLKQKKYHCLNSFIDRDLWIELDREERELLAQLFISYSEQQIYSGSNHNEEEIKDFFSFALTLAPEEPELIRKIAMGLFRYGLMYKKINFLNDSLEKILFLSSKCTEYFNSSYELWHLWGNTLVALGQFSGDLDFCNQSLEKFKKALVILEQSIESEESPFQRNHLNNKKAEIFWHTALAWLILGKRSGEVSDLTTACENFRSAKSFFVYWPPAFLMDFGTALVALARMLGKSCYVLEAMELFKESIYDSYAIYEEEKPNSRSNESVYLECWFRYAESWKTLYELTGSPLYFNEADLCFEQAMTICSKKEALWLSWTKLHLTYAWHNREIHGFESAIEKLTSIHSDKCDVIRLASCFGQALVGLGIIWDDLKFLREGTKRVLDFFEIAPDHPELLKGIGFSYIGFGNYFNDEKYFLKGIEVFEKLIPSEEFCSDGAHGLYLSCLALGELKREPEWLLEAQDRIERVCELRPENPYFWNEWGLALMKLRDYEQFQEDWISIAEKAVNKFEKAIELRESLELEPELDWLYNCGVALDFLAEETMDESLYEKAIVIFKKVLEKDSHQQTIYHLALTLSRLGEHALDADYLIEADQFFAFASAKEVENELFWYDWGYAILNLSEFVYDKEFPEKSLELKKKAEKYLMHSASLGNVYSYYLLACLHSLTENFDQSILFLKRAQSMDALPSSEDLMKDEWLEKVRNTEKFRDFIALFRG